MRSLNEIPLTFISILALCLTAIQPFTSAAIVFDLYALLDSRIISNSKFKMFCHRVVACDMCERATVVRSTFVFFVRAKHALFNNRHFAPSSMSSLPHWAMQKRVVTGNSHFMVNVAESIATIAKRSIFALLLFSRFDQTMDGIHSICFALELASLVDFYFYLFSTVPFYYNCMIKCH